MCRVIGELRPAWVIGENVAGIISMELDAVLFDLESTGYATRAFVIPAVAVDAPHRRDRVWIVARDRDRDREPACAINDEVAELCGVDTGRSVADAGSQYWVGTRKAISAGRIAVDDGNTLVMADADGAGSQRRQQCGQCAEECLARSRIAEFDWPPFDAGVCGMDDGLPHRAHRLRVLGNSIVPQIAEVIGRAIIISSHGIEAKTMADAARTRGENWKEAK